MSEVTDFVSAAGQAVAALAAVIGLPAIWWQLRSARKDSDLQALHTFLLQVKEHENKLQIAEPEGKETAFIEYLNFIEIYSAALNGSLFPPISREIVNDKIIDFVVLIDDAPAWRSIFSNAITSKTTFSHFHKFIKKHKTQIDKAKIVHQHLG